MEGDWYTVNDAAMKVGINPAAMYKRVQRGFHASRKEGYRVLVWLTVADTQPANGEPEAGTHAIPASGYSHEEDWDAGQG